ncbi:MAG: SMI1/KNR4 family protein [Candidatus Nealsonbacteria bacterium]
MNANLECPICGKKKRKVKDFICNNCYRNYLKKEGISLPEWVKEEKKRRLQLIKIEQERFLKEIDFFERILGLQFPQSYRQFLLEEGSAIIDGFNISGTPTKEVKTSVLETTQILRTKRPDLSNKLVAISIDKNRALCLDLEKATKKDVPLVEVDLTGKEFLEFLKMKPRFFNDWIKHHQEISRRLAVAWNKVRNRQKEAEEGRGKGIRQWRTVISRVKDYIIALGAFRYDFFKACLEVDEFYTFDQPGLVKDGSAVRILVNEMFSRARDYSGSLNIIFTKDIREDINGKVHEEFKKMREKRAPREIPKEILEIAEKYGINFKEAEKGIIFHEEGVKLYFVLLDLSPEIEEKIIELEKAGYLSREMIAEAICKGIWTREEVIWLFLNAPRPEGIILGTDLPENRLFYSESFNYGRSALLATRFRQAIMAYITGGVSVEEIEKVKARCYLEPKEKFWILKCNQRFCIPPSWTIDKSEKWVEAEEPVILLSKPRFSADPEYDKTWIEDNVKMLLDCEMEVKTRCLLLSNEMINTLMLNIIYKDKNPEKILREIKNLVKVSETVEGMHILFAPTRMYLLLDEEVQKRMNRTRNMRHFPQRRAPLELWIIEVPEEGWKKPSGLRNASTDARTFGRLITKKVDINRYRKDFAFNCEVVEREAFQNYTVIAEFKDKEAEDLLNALKIEDSDYQGITFSYVRPTEIPEFRKKIKNTNLLSVLEEVQGGIVVINPPWKPLPIELILETPEIKEQAELPSELIERIHLAINERKKDKQYISSRREIDRLHSRAIDSLKNNTPLSMNSIRSHVFVEGIRDYLYQSKEIKKEIMLRVAYGDGTQEEPLSLFAFPEIKRPSGKFYYLPLSLVSLRHMEVDYFTEMSLIRNVEIQRKETSADQQEFAFREVYSQIEEIIKLLRKEVEEEDLSLSFRALLIRRPEMKNEYWDGLELDIYLSTGLTPAAVGAFRAVIELLRKYRGQLVVKPRIISARLRKNTIEKEGLGGIRNNYYGEASEWY